jgi:hypothetical protein
MASSRSIIISWPRSDASAAWQVKHLVGQRRPDRHHQRGDPLAGNAGEDVQQLGILGHGLPLWSEEGDTERCVLRSAYCMVRGALDAPRNTQHAM